jgi:hypothetical protein
MRITLLFAAAIEIGPRAYPSQSGDIRGMEGQEVGGEGSCECEQRKEEAGLFTSNPGLDYYFCCRASI